jgi:hypothetical protein
MRYIAGIVKQHLMNYYWVCAYVKVFAVWHEGLDMFKLKAIATGGRGFHR